MVIKKRASITHAHKLVAHLGVQLCKPVYECVCVGVCGCLLVDELWLTCNKLETDNSGENYLADNILAQVLVWQQS